MKIHRIEALPAGFEYFTSSPFDEYEIAQIPNSVEELWYWYGSAPYEGAGNIIMRTVDGLWHHHNCGHCSCYEATSHIDLKDGSPLDVLLSRCSSELMRELQPLVDAINEPNQ